MSHHHHHGDEIKSELSFDEKMIKLLEHWIKHNEDHVRTYRDWAQLLEDVAEMTLLINKKFESAMKLK